MARINLQGERQGGGTWPGSRDRRFQKKEEPGKTRLLERLCLNTRPESQVQQD